MTDILELTSRLAHELFRTTARLACAASLFASGVSAQTTTEPARPMNRCQLQGDHVAGVVSVDLLDGIRTELPLIDVVATVAMAPRLEDVVVYVSAPLTFEGRLVPGERGGPAAFSARGYHSADRSIRLAPREPLEMRLAASDDRATLRVPTIYGEGAMEVDVPCADLRAGRPTATTTRTPPNMRGEFLRIVADATVRVSADPSSAQVARFTVTRGERVTVKGRIVGRGGGFAHVSFSVGPVSIDGYVPDSKVESAGRNLVPVTQPILQLAAQMTMLGSERETRVVTLPVGTLVYATATAQRPWTNVTAPLRVTVSRYIGSDRRFGVVESEPVVVTRTCSVDGIGPGPTCAGLSTAPRVGLFACNGNDCTSRAYVELP